MKKILYPLIGHSCTTSDLQPLQQPIDREVLHLLGLNEHFPRAVLHTPFLYGGMGCSSVHAQPTIEKLMLFIHHIREGGQIKEALLSSMSITQLECGLATPFVSLDAGVWSPLVTPTWITHLWTECNPRGIEIKFQPDTFWIPRPPRERDVCIMEVASQMYQGAQLWQINMCRIALKASYLSDIAAVDGRRILLAYYQGKMHQESGRRTRTNWPPVGELPKAWWLVWQEFLTRWCGTALRIPTPLGGWYEGVKIITQCCFFLYERRLIMQQKDAYMEFPLTILGLALGLIYRLLPFTISIF